MCKDVLVCGEIHKSVHSMIIVSIVNFLKSLYVRDNARRGVQYHLIMDDAEA